MLHNLFSIRQFRLTKWSFLVHSTTRNAPYIHPSHDLILELWRTFPNDPNVRVRIRTLKLSFLMRLLNRMNIEQNEYM